MYIQNEGKYKQIIILRVVGSITRRFLQNFVTKNLKKINAANKETYIYAHQKINIKNGNNYA